jgi:predicted Na+-dependent transporter
MELGIHNSTLAIAVATTISTELAIPAAVYSSFMFVSAGILARLMHRRNATRVWPDADHIPSPIRRRRSRSG